jgi:hypothetical protein
MLPVPPYLSLFCQITHSHPVSFAVMDYKVPFRAFSKQAIRDGRNPLPPNYVGRMRHKPVCDMDGPLEDIDDALIHIERGVREVTMEEWVKLK